MCGIPAKKSRGRLDNALLIDVPENRVEMMGSYGLSSVPTPG
jgi:hypothetical protein